MAKKIRFPLQMKETSVRTIEELRDNFDLESVLGYFTNGKLVTWLKDRYYDNEAMAVEALTSDDENLRRKLYDIMKVPYTEDAIEIDIGTVKRRTEKLVLLRKFIDDENIIDNVDSVAFNQDDLLDILDEGIKTIYLYEGRFEIPLSVKGITYIGLKNPVVLLRDYDKMDFSSLNLKFTDVYFDFDMDSINEAERKINDFILLKSSSEMIMSCAIKALERSKAFI
ncbi:MAG: hypothetical protein NC244_11535 [Alistipes senegalensis]|nr:hypothetical protein [Alistipes senegalensis]